MGSWLIMVDNCGLINNKLGICHDLTSQTDLTHKTLWLNQLTMIPWFAVIRKYVIYHDLISTSRSFPYYVNQHGLSRRQRFIQRQIILTLIAHGGADTWASEAENGLFLV